MRIWSARSRSMMCWLRHGTISTRMSTRSLWPGRNCPPCHSGGRGTRHMLRIGVDMIEIERIRQAMERHGERFFARFFTATEREQSCEIPARLAARFAAKEAAAKALGTGIGDVCWVDIEI
ncbi:MAG: 4'-phosphopantetheinyl transferase superfamily protein, partial [Chloroflexi bacterium]